MREGREGKSRTGHLFPQMDLSAAGGQGEKKAGSQAGRQAGRQGEGRRRGHGVAWRSASHSHRDRCKMEFPTTRTHYLSALSVCEEPSERGSSEPQAAISNLFKLKRGGQIFFPARTTHELRLTYRIDIDSSPGRVEGENDIVEINEGEGGEGGRREERRRWQA